MEGLDLEESKLMRKKLNRARSPEQHAMVATSTSNDDLAAGYVNQGSSLQSLPCTCNMKVAASTEGGEGAQVPEVGGAVMPSVFSIDGERTAHCAYERAAGGAPLLLVAIAHGREGCHVGGCRKGREGRGCNRC